MTGTSCDGLDAACLQFGDIAGEWTPLWATTAPYPKALRERVLRSQKPGTRLTSADWLALDRDLGQWYGRTIQGILSDSEHRADVIANHGQTVAHWPSLRGGGATWQLGSPAWIAQATGLTVISGFRGGDIAAGGQGAPLVPRYHAEIARKMAAGASASGVAFHNIGGISNLTYCRNSELIAFDTGPGNAWMDEAASRATKGRRKFDDGGRLAASGVPDERAVSKLLALPYFKKSPPKSTGRDDFPFERLARATRARGADLVATATLLTARSIARAYEAFILKPGHPLAQIWICGGGAHNPTLISWIQHELGQSIQVRALTQDPWRPEWIEAQAFAYLGWLSLRGQALGGDWTGASSDAPPATILPGRNWRQVLAQIKA